MKILLYACYFVGCVNGVQRVCARIVAILYIKTFMTFDDLDPRLFHNR